MSYWHHQKCSNRHKDTIFTPSSLFAWVKSYSLPGSHEYFKKTLNWMHIRLHHIILLIRSVHHIHYVLLAMLQDKAEGKYGLGRHQNTVQWVKTYPLKKNCKKSYKATDFAYVIPKMANTHHPQELDCWSATSRQGPHLFLFLLPASNIRSYGEGQSHHHHDCLKRPTATDQKRC